MSCSWSLSSVHSMVVVAVLWVLVKDVVRLFEFVLDWYRHLVGYFVNWNFLF